MSDQVEYESGDARLPPPPPPPPEPSAITSQGDDTVLYGHLSDEPHLHLNDENWNISGISSHAALRMLIVAMQSLAEATGDVPPTPPVSRPAIPCRELRPDPPSRRTSSPEGGDHVMSIGSPEARPHEPLTVEVGVGAEEVAFQRIAIARRFFSRTVPTFSLDAYLTRFHLYCPHSPGVYLAAAVYCQRLCVADIMVPATSRTVHRLSLAAIRVAAKALEDNKWPQDRVAAIGGISRTQLLNLELALCYLLDFELGVNSTQLARCMFLLQQAARQSLVRNNPLSKAFRLRLSSKRLKVGSGV